MIVIPPPPPLPVVKAALVQRLEADYLTVRWVNCFRDRGIYRSVRVTRCRVNFGDPHVVQYCVILVGRRVVTDHERRAIRCGLRPDPTLPGGSMGPG